MSRRVDLDLPARATILAALRFWQAQLTDGRAPTGVQLEAIHTIAGRTGYQLFPEDIDELCADINGGEV